MGFLTRLTEFMWNPWLLGMFLLVGVWFSVRTGFFQLFGFKRWMGTTLGSILRKKGDGETGITKVQALATALASTIGTGSIAGVATAIFFGGPGAVFWMWVCALLGMMTGYAEKVLTIRFRRRGPDGQWQGGPMYYLSQGLGSRFLANWFALACVGGALMGGNLVQSNSISDALESAFGWNRLAVGIGTAVAAGIVLAGGIERIARFSERMVPVMVLLFVGSAVIVLADRRMYLADVLQQIFAHAFTPMAAAGGGAGYSISTALRYGVARGVFTNEAGMGSSALAHANADSKDAGEQGMWGMLEVFIATVVICTMTALVILSAGVYDPQKALEAIQSDSFRDVAIGVPLASESFAVVLGRTGELIVDLSLLLFSFSSLVGWSYYGEAALSWLTCEKYSHVLWRGIFLAVTVAGSVSRIDVVWQLVDLFTAWMALPNLGALVMLSPEVLECFDASVRSKNVKIPALLRR